MPDDRSEYLANRLLEGLEQLRDGACERAAEAFAEVHSAPEIMAASHMTDIRIRALTLHAQAVLETGGIELAQTSVLEAMRLARLEGDTVGLSQARALQKRVLERRDERSRNAIAASQAKRIAEAPLSDIRKRLAPHPQQLCDALIKKSNALLDLGQHDEAYPLATEALQTALPHGWLREEVLARLSIARARPSEAPEQLYLAWRRSERASDFTMVGTVARAADLQGVSLPTQVGPDMSRGPTRTEDT